MSIDSGIMTAARHFRHLDDIPDPSTIMENWFWFSCGCLEVDDEQKDLDKIYKEMVKKINELMEKEE